MSGALLGASDASLSKADQVPCPAGAYMGAGEDRKYLVNVTNYIVCWKVIRVMGQKRKGRPALQERKMKINL